MTDDDRALLVSAKLDGTLTNGTHYPYWLLTPWAPGGPRTWWPVTAEEACASLRAGLLSIVATAKADAHLAHENSTQD